MFHKLLREGALKQAVALNPEPRQFELIDIPAGVH